jgi:Mn2+/Fe2+ NRAMP family transporter
MAHPGAGTMAHGFVTPVLPGGSGQMATVMLVVIGIVGTTVAPWQLFFQQSYVIDKRITPRFMKYEKADLGLGIVVVVVGAAAPVGLGAVAAAHLAGSFTDAADVARGLTVYGGRVLGDMFAVALLDASIIGAFAVSLSTAYAMGDCLKINHSLHRGVKQAKGFYAVYAGIIAFAATIVLVASDHVQGVLTVGVQALAGVLLPSASVYLLLLCVDKDVLGPWVNSRKSTVIAVLVALSLVLTGSVLDRNITAGQIEAILGGCAAVALAFGAWMGVKALRARRAPGHVAETVDRSGRDTWRTPPLGELGQVRFSTGTRVGLAVLRTYLAVATVLVAVKLASMMLGH